MDGLLGLRALQYPGHHGTEGQRDNATLEEKDMRQSVTELEAALHKAFGTAFAPVSGLRACMEVLEKYTEAIEKREMHGLCDCTCHD